VWLVLGGGFVAITASILTLKFLQK